MDIRAFLSKPKPKQLHYHFECCLFRLIEGDEIMEAFDDEDNSKENNYGIFTRAPTEAEWADIQFPGQVLRLPYNWRWDYPVVDGKRKFYEIQEFRITDAQWAAGSRWTMRRCVDTMRKFYGAHKNRKARSLGDHMFFEGFDKDGHPYFGS